MFDRSLANIRIYGSDEFLSLQYHNRGLYKTLSHCSFVDARMQQVLHSQASTANLNDLITVADLGGMGATAPPLHDEN